MKKRLDKCLDSPYTSNIMTGKEIKATRAKLGLTQVEFAVLVGVRGETIHRWEAGKYKPHAIFTRRIRELGKRKGAAA